MLLNNPSNFSHTQIKIFNKHYQSTVENIIPSLTLCTDSSLGNS